MTHSGARGHLVVLDAMAITSAQRERTGSHPAIGAVTLTQLLWRWVARTVGRIAQVASVMATQ